MIGRILQGISAAVVWIVGLALIVDTVGPAHVGQAMGYVAVGMSMGVLIGPFLGGVVYARSGYNAVFGMTYGLIVLDILLRVVLIERKIAKRWDTEEGEAEPATNETPLEKTGDHDNENPAADGPLQIQDPEKDVVVQQEASDAATAAEVIEPREVAGPETRPLRERLPPVITLLTSRRLLAALWGILVQASLMTSFDSVLPLFVQRTFGWDSTGAGTFMAGCPLSS